jgi:hypothetical protein
MAAFLPDFELLIQATALIDAAQWPNNRRLVHYRTVISEPVTPHLATFTVVRARTMDQGFSPKCRTLNPSVLTLRDHIPSASVS